MDIRHIDIDWTPELERPVLIAGFTGWNDAADAASVAVVTSPLHTHRACAAFEKVGFIVSCVPSESRSVALRNPRLATDRLRAFQLWLYELAGLTLYRARGWI
jgi:uncharacterized SAM-binding protein YcdF (DUF218 family)